MDIKEEMANFDLKNRDFFDNLTTEDKKKFSTFMMIRWGATITGDPDLQEYYLRACNQRLNKHFFDINTKVHDKLHWLLATTVSPGMGKMYHPWLGLKKKEAGSNKVRKFLETQYPSMKMSEIDLMVKLNDTASVKQLATDLGWSKEKIKKELS